MKKLKCIFIISLICLLPSLSYTEDTGSDSDFEGADVAVPKQKVKTLDDVSYVENYGDYSEFQEGVDAEEIDAEGFYRLGRLFSIGVDVGYASFTGGFAEMNDPALRYGLKGTYFFGVSFALEMSVHYQKHPFHIYDTDGVSGWIGTNKIITTGITGKYYLDTKFWSDFVSWINPHFYAGFESMEVDTEAYYEPGENPTSPAYLQNERVWGTVVGIGLEFQIFSMTYLGVNAKYHYIELPDEGITDKGYSFDGDIFTSDVSIIWYY